jgi:hypothetical protein
LLDPDVLIGGNVMKAAAVVFYASFATTMIVAAGLISAL